MIKVSELIKILEKHKPESVVILATDAEGNDSTSLSEVTAQMYRAGTRSWDGQLYIPKLTPELIESGYTADDLCPDDNCQDAVVLWPV